MRRYDFILIGLAFLSIPCLAAGYMATGLIMTIIGIPLAAVILLLPSLVMLLGLARLIDRLVLRPILRDPLLSGGIAVALAIAALASFAIYDNAVQHRAALALQADDHDNLARPIPDQVIAYVTTSPSVRCDDFCQRLLLTGQARQVLLAQGETAPAGEPDWTMPVQAWQITDLPHCPPVDLPATTSFLQIEGEPAWPNAPRADLIIAEGILAGHCLVSNPATLGDADLVITDMVLREAVRPTQAGFSLGDNLFGATRRAIWVKTEQGWAEQARWTHVTASEMVVPALVAAQIDLNANTRPGFIRQKAEGYPPAPGFASFASKVLGLRVTPEDRPVPQSGPAAPDPLQALLAGPGSPDDNTLKLLSLRLNAMFLQKTTPQADLDLFLQAFADDRLPLTEDYWRVIWTLVQNAPPDFAPAVARIGFARLDGLLLPDPYDKDISLVGHDEAVRLSAIKRGIGTIGKVLAVLPDSALQPYGPTLIALSRNHENRPELGDLLPRMSSLGEAGARALVDLLADAKTSYPDHSIYGDQQRTAYFAALLGLCRMGQEAAFVLPDVMRLVDRGDVTLSEGGWGTPAAVTLIRLGQPVESLPAIAARANRPMKQGEFDMIAGRAQDIRSCRY